MKRWSSIAAEEVAAAQRRSHGGSAKWHEGGGNGACEGRRCDAGGRCDTEVGAVRDSMRGI